MPDDLSAAIGRLEATARRPTVMFDFDDTLGFWHEAAIAALNARGYNLDVRSAPYKLDGFVRSADQAWWQTWKQDPETVWCIAPDFRTVDFMRLLVAADFDVFVCSNHAPSAAASLNHWIDYWASVTLKVVAEGRGTKQRMAAGYGPTDPLVWVDDDPRKWTCVRSGVEIAALVRPWTPPTAPAHVTLINEVPAIGDLVGLSSGSIPATA